MAVSLPKLLRLRQLSRVELIVRSIMLGSLGIILFTIASGLQAGAFGNGAGSVEGGVLALSSNGRELAVLSPYDGGLLGTIELEYEASHITPTPGGVSVFVSFVGRDELWVYSTTQYELQEVISFGGRVPEYLLFSENGETLFVSYVDVPVISAFNHSMRRLDLSFEFEVPGSYGPLYRNRRATRLYRATPEGVAVIFTASGEVVETITVGVSELAFNHDHTHIWTIATDLSPAASMAVRQESQTGVPLLIEERSGSMRRIDELVRTGPVFANTQRETPGSEQAAFLSAAGDGVLFFDSRTGEQEGMLELPFVANELLESGVGSIWAVDSEGRLAVIDPVRGSVRQIGQRHMVAARVLMGSVVQTDGNFACF